MSVAIQSGTLGPGRSMRDRTPIRPPEPRHPDLPDDELPVPRLDACRQPVRAGRDRQQPGELVNTARGSSARVLNRACMAGGGTPRL